ncbi:hypothetical protein Tco_0512224 [Tanacetum coccineum]
MLEETIRKLLEDNTQMRSRMEVEIQVQCNDHTVSSNKEGTSSLAVNIHDIERQIIKGKLVLVGDYGIPLKPLNADGQATSMDHFPCMSNMFGTPNTTTKVATASTSYTPSNNAQDGSVNVIKSDKLNDTWSRSYANRLNGEPSKKVANFRIVIDPLSSWIRRMKEGRYVVLRIMNTRFLVKTWRCNAISLFMDTAYWSEMSNH